ncbi:MAG: hypothetical protein V4675_12940 [Verrucomicrobiota bacterium]
MAAETLRLGNRVLVSKESDAIRKSASQRWLGAAGQASGKKFLKIILAILTYFV